MLRALINAGNEISGSAFSTDGRTAAQILDDAERLVFAIAEKGSRGRKGFKSLKQILPETVDRIDELHQSDGSITGISSGFSKFDEMTAGLQGGDLIIVAGRPSMLVSTSWTARPALAAGPPRVSFVISSDWCRSMPSWAASAAPGRSIVTPITRRPAGRAECPCSGPCWAQ